MRTTHQTWAHGGFLALAAVTAWLATGTFCANFMMLDEYGHVPAGISYWQLGSFELYRENPPLVQCLVALPPLASKATVDYSKAARGRSEWDVGDAFMRRNAARLQDLLIASRSVVLLLSLACGALIFWWARENYGAVPALACASLWLLDPTVLAFSGVVTCDVGAAAFGCLASFAFWHFLRRPGAPQVVLAGTALGLALGTKFNMAMLCPAWLVLAVAARGVPRGTGRERWSGLALVFLVGLFVLNSLYAFEGTFTPLGSFEFKSRALSGERTYDVDNPPAGNRFRRTWLADLPTPAPRHYVLGLDSQKWEEEVALRNLDGGRLTRGGRWYTPLVSLGRKLPLGTLLLLGLAFVYWVAVDRRFRAAELVAWAPGIILLGTLCANTGLNWAVRYALSALPLFFVAAGQFVAFAWDRRLWRWALLACLGWNGVEVARAWPFFLSYANEAAGGPAGGQRVFHGSNYDWGQDLIRFRRWYDANPGLRPLAFSYYGVIEAEFAGVPEGKLPTCILAERGPSAGRGERAPGQFYWAISSNILNGMTGRFALEDGSMLRGYVRSRHLVPANAVARVGSTIYVFRVDASGAGTPPRPGIRLRDLEGCLHIYTGGDGLDASP